MGLMKWDDSPYWKMNRSQTRVMVVETEPEPEPFVEPELPILTTPRTAKEITEAIKDDPRYNAINPSNQQHIIGIAITQARNNGMLIEELGV